MNTYYSRKHVEITAELGSTSLSFLTPHLTFFLLRSPEDHIESVPINDLISRFLLDAKLRNYIHIYDFFYRLTTSYSINNEKEEEEEYAK